MPHLFVVHGVGFRIESEFDPYSIVSTFEEDKRYVKLKQKASASGLTLDLVANSDDGSVGAFVGRELLKSRHIYQCQTHAVELSETPSPELANELRDFLSSHEGVTVVETDGIVVSQFD